MTAVSDTAALAAIGAAARELKLPTVRADAARLAGGHVASVIPIGALARYDRPAPTLAGYDQLLSGGTR